jgi:hypothetical protein
MRMSLRALRALPCLVLLGAACATDSTQPRETPSLVVGGDDCPFPYLTSGILEPINRDSSSTFHLGRTLPVKVRIFECGGSGAGVNTLAPQISLALVDVGGGLVNEIESSSAADEGTTMRSAGNGQYIFNLSTKRSQFNAGEDLQPGMYQLRISSPGMFEDVVVQFALQQ